MSLKNWIVEKDGQVCGKYRTATKPVVSDDYTVAEVDDLTDYTVDQWHYE